MSISLFLTPRSLNTGDLFTTSHTQQPGSSYSSIIRNTNYNEFPSPRNLERIFDEDNFEEDYGLTSDTESDSEDGYFDYCLDVSNEDQENRMNSDDCTTAQTTMISFSMK